MVWEGQLSDISSFSVPFFAVVFFTRGTDVHPIFPSLSTQTSPFNPLQLPDTAPPTPPAPSRPHEQSHTGTCTSPRVSTCPRPSLNGINCHCLVRRRRVHDRGAMWERGQVCGCGEGGKRTGKRMATRRVLTDEDRSSRRTWRFASRLSVWDADAVEEGGGPALALRRRWLVVIALSPVDQQPSTIPHSSRSPEVQSEPNHGHSGPGSTVSWGGE